MSGFSKIVFREFSYITRDTNNNGVDDRMRKREYQLYISGETKKPLKLYFFVDKDEAWATANELADKLKMDLRIINN